MRRRPSLRALLAILIVAVAVVVPVAAWVTRTETTCGIVVDIQQTSITEVTGFTIRSPDGSLTSYVIVPSRLAPDSFVPGHLREHRAIAWPVCVTAHPGDAPLVALDMRDGPLPSF